MVETVMKELKEEEEGQRKRRWNNMNRGEVKRR